MNIIVLTSSRAEYSVYYPLLKKLQEDNYFDLNIIAFGTHLSIVHGYTLNEILKDGFRVKYKVESMIAADSPEAISTSMSLTSMKFASLWDKEQRNTDLIVCIGDRFEMFAAVSASIPFNIPIAHIQGGELTMGSIDDIFRNSLTHMSTFHFPSTQDYADRIKHMIGSDKNVFNTGALSFDSIRLTKIMSKQEFNKKFHIDISKPMVLVTLHPETKRIGRNKKNAEVLVEVLATLKEQILITMPNADASSMTIREILLDFANKHPNNVAAVENLGGRAYFTAMQKCSFMMGNSSSAILESAYYPKWVIDLGDRQKGRLKGNHIKTVPFNKKTILKTIDEIKTTHSIPKIDVYGDGYAAEKIVDILKNKT